MTAQELTQWVVDAVYHGNPAELARYLRRTPACVQNWVKGANTPRAGAIRIMWKIYNDHQAQKKNLISNWITEKTNRVPAISELLQQLDAEQLKLVINLIEVIKNQNRPISIRIEDISISQGDLCVESPALAESQTFASPRGHTKVG